ncbi:hypothetical protein E4U21_006390 [Claviceps maximensis]|nr:hypothetical protein E4U21_006390 [Claviceps maximensis]
MAAGWFYSRKQIASYFASRITSLKPPNALTISLMFRAVGALIFGAFADHYGCKWPMMAALFLFFVVELASGFCQNLPQLLAVRSLYGIAMGGMYGPAASTALSDVPYDARGVLSGVFQIAYAFGSLIVSVLYRALVPTTKPGWRSLFWFSAVPPLFIMIFRWYMPETNHFLDLRAKQEELSRAMREEAEISPSSRKRTADLLVFVKESAKATRDNWVLFIYLIMLLAAFNSCAHGSQDLYPTFLKNQLEFNATQAAIVTVAGQVGAIIGASVMGYLSTFWGLRLTMLAACVCGGVLVPAYTMPREMGVLAATNFLEQASVAGAWGPMPIHLMELTPPTLRTTAVGLTYQLGNLASSASATIEAIMGEQFPLPPSFSSVAGKTNRIARYDYGKVMTIFICSMWAITFVLLLIGPEMSHEERKEEEEDARRLEALRKGEVYVGGVEEVVPAYTVEQDEEQGEKQLSRRCIEQIS